MRIRENIGISEGPSDAAWRMALRATGQSQGDNDSHERRPALRQSGCDNREKETDRKRIYDVKLRNIVMGYMQKSSGGCQEI